VKQNDVVLEDSLNSEFARGVYDSDAGVELVDEGLEGVTTRL